MAHNNTLGKYKLISEIGQGGFATVYRAEDAELEREVALKVLSPILTNDPQWVNLFYREARAVARLQHPHIITVYEIGQDQGLLYIAMQYIPGGSLADRLTHIGPLPWRKTITLLKQIAAALDYAHLNGVIHRDLKPHNILLDAERGAFLTDFGFAGTISQSGLSPRLSNGLVGTPNYIPPEIWEDKPPTAQTDIYGLGCLLYECLQGTPLFRGETLPAVMHAHFAPLKLPATWPGGAPQGINRALEKCLARLPEMRYKTATQFVDVLYRAGVNPPTDPSPKQKKGRGWFNWPPRRTLLPTWAWLPTVILLTLLILFLPGRLPKSQSDYILPTDITNPVSYPTVTSSLTPTPYLSLNPQAPHELFSTAIAPADFTIQATSTATATPPGN